MQNQTDVVVVCPGCKLAYVQRVTGRYIGPRRRAPNYDRPLQQRCKEYGQTDGKDRWHGLMYCTECSVRMAPPSLRNVVRKWMEEGERSL